MTDTTRLSLPRPTGTDLISNGDNVITEIANTLDDAAIFSAGTFAARPSAASLSGRIYLATDTGGVYLSSGSAWIELSSGGVVPIGGSIDYAGAGDPADTRFLLEDGRAISRATYSALFSLIGTTYGAGNGTTTFNIPDSRGRGSVAPDDMGTAAGAAGRMASNNTRGASGGAETRSLASGNLPPHTHDQGTLATASSGSHDHTVGTLAVTGDGAHTHGIGTVALAGSGTLTTGAETEAHTHSGNTGAGGSSIITGTGLTLAVTPYTGSSGPDYWVHSTIVDHTHPFTTGFQSTGHLHNLASHTHTISGSVASATHTHGLSGNVASNGAHTHSISGATGSVGSGTAYNQMAPYVVKNKIIRVL